MIFLNGIGMIAFMVSSFLAASPSYGTDPVIYMMVLWLGYASITSVNFVQAIYIKSDMPTDEIKLEKSKDAESQYELENEQAKKIVKENQIAAEV
jgi:hypothetical protein